MNTKTHLAGSTEISEIISGEIVIKTVDDALDIIGNSPSSNIVMYTHNFENEFFDLSTRKLGEILQKFTTYRVKLAIIGDFSTYPSETLKDFIYESNKHGEYLFVSSLEVVLKTWKR